MSLSSQINNFIKHKPSIYLHRFIKIFVFEMSYELSHYEIHCSKFFVTWKVKINKSVTKEQVEDAAFKLAKEYNYLSSEFKPGTMILEYKENYHPQLHYHDKPITDEDYFRDIRESTFQKTDITSVYYIYVDKENNVSDLIGVYNHAMVDGGSGLDLSYKFCRYLSDPTLEPKNHGYASIQRQIVIPKGVEGLTYNYIDKTTPILTFPKYLHECNDLDKVSYHVKTELIRNEDLSNILKCTHNNHFTFQSLLWLTTLFAQMKIHNMYDFSKEVRFHAMAMSKGRCEFNPPILNDDIVCGAAFVYVGKKINKEDNIIELLKDISTSLHQELDRGQQMYDFFINSDHSFYPPFSMSCCTLGKSLCKKHYDGPFSFDVIEQNLFPDTSLFQGLANNLIFSFTVEGVGCYISAPFTYPHFYDEEITGYLKHMINLMNFICNEENMNKTIEDLTNL